VVERGEQDHGRLWSLALLAAPVLFFVGYALHPDLPEDAASALAEVAEVRGQYLGAKLLVAVGALGLVPLVAVVARRVVASGRGGGLAIAGAALTIVGTVFNALSQATFGYLFWFATAPGVSRQAGLDVVAASQKEGLATLPVSFLSIPVFAVGLLLLAAALWRCGRVPRWVPVLLAVSDVLAGAIGVGPLMLVAGVMVTAAFLGALLTTREEGATALAP
jgi:hypothetical protein